LYLSIDHYRSVYVIGDIHGCRRALDELLKYLNPSTDDLVITLGDYIDRGEDSAGVINSLLGLSKKTNWLGLRGNHEQMLLNVLEGTMNPAAWLEYGGISTISSYHCTDPEDFMPEEHVNFLQSLHESIETEEFFLTHASYDPDLPFDQQPPELLRWQHLRGEIPLPHHSGKTVVVGHTPNLEGEVLDFGHLICLDTYCHGGGWLSAMELKSRAVWQFSQWGKQRTQRGYLSR